MPRLRSNISNRAWPSAGIQRSTTARVASVEPSSTMTSWSTSGYSSSSTAATVGSSLYAGTTAMRRESNISELIGMRLHVPVEGASYAFVDVDGGGPIEQLTSALADHDARGEVTGPRRSELDERPRHQLLGQLGEAADRHRLGSVEVDDRVLGLWPQRLHERLREVLDVHEVADLATVAVDAQGLAGQGPAEERRQHGGRTH